MFKKLMVLLTVVMMIAVGTLPALAATEVEPIVVLAENYSGHGKDTLTVTSGVASVKKEDWTPSKATGGSAGIVIPFNKWQWLSYNVEAAVAGTYKLTATAGVPSGLGGFVIYGDSDGIGSLCETYCEPSGNWTSYADYEVGTVNLKAGSNYIKVMNTTSGMYFDKLTFTKVDDEPYVQKINCEYYTDSYKNSTGKAGVAVEYLSGIMEYVLSYQVNDWVEYEVNIPEAGAYILSARAGSTGAKLEITINDALSFHGAVTSSGALTTFNVSDLGKILLNEGKNTIKVKNLSSGFYFEGLTLTKLDTAKDLDLADYYDSSENVVISETQVSLAEGEWVSYVFESVMSGAYEFDLNGDFDVYVDDEKIASTENGKVTVPVIAEISVIKFVAKEAVTLTEIKADIVSASMKFEAESCEASYCNSKGTAFVINATTKVLSFNTKDWAAYTINAPEAGSYLITTYGASVGGAKLNIVSGMDNDDFIIGSGMTNNDGTDWSCPASNTNICRINLTKGANVIRIVNAGGGYSFDSFMVTYMGEAKAADGFELSVENALYRYDFSDKKVLPVSTASGSLRKYVSFGLNDYMNFELYAPAAGVYTVDAYSAFPQAGPKVAVANKGVGIVSGATNATTGYYDFAPTAIGEIAVKEGKNEIQIMSIGAQFHFEKLVLSLKNSGAVEKAFEINAESYMFGGEGIGYHDNTLDIDNEDIHIYRGDDVEVISVDGGLAVDMEAEEWLCYTIDVPKAGYYNVQAYAAGNVVSTYSFSAAQQVKFYVNDALAATNNVPALVNGIYVPVNAGDVYLPEGENTFKFELAKGAICIDKIIFTTSDVELTKENGTISAKGNLNGLFGGKDVLCVLAVYDGDNRLVDVDVDEFTGGVNDMVNLSSSADGNAKLFIWNNQQGNVNILD